MLWEWWLIVLYTKRVLWSWWFSIPVYRVIVPPCGGVCPSIVCLPPQDQASKDKALQNMAALSSAQIVSPSLISKSQLPPLPPAHYPRAAVRVFFIYSTASLATQTSNYLCNPPPPSWQPPILSPLIHTYSSNPIYIWKLTLLIDSMPFSFGLVQSQDSLDPLRSEYYYLLISYMWGDIQGA